MSTSAHMDGSVLVLAVEGVDRPFRVDPLSGARGADLTRLFVKLVAGELTEMRGESLFVEAIGPANYARITGEHIRLVPLDENDERFLEWGPSGIVHGEKRDAHAMLAAGAVFVRWEAPTPLPDDVIDARENPIRHEPGQRLAMIAFLWQTALGMDGVEQFIADGEGTDARLKAMSHFAIRAGRSHTPSSSQVATEPSSTAASSATTDGQTSSGSVRVPAKAPKGRRTPRLRG